MQSALSCSSSAWSARFPANSQVLFACHYGSAALPTPSLSCTTVMLMQAGIRQLAGKLRTTCRASASPLTCFNTVPAVNVDTRHYPSVCVFSALLLAQSPLAADSDCTGPSCPSLDSRACWQQALQRLQYSLTVSVVLRE